MWISSQFSLLPRLAQLKNTNRFKRGQMWPTNNHLATFIKIQFKSLTHSVPFELITYHSFELITYLSFELITYHPFEIIMYHSFELITYHSFELNTYHPDVLMVLTLLSINSNYFDVLVRNVQKHLKTHFNGTLKQWFSTLERLWPTKRVKNKYGDAYESLIHVLLI